MTQKDGNWKKHLLRTSVPLEHEATRILSQGGFSVSADYSYNRMDGGVEKEFSVDVHGVTSHEHHCVLDVLVECKYRERGTTWLFLPEPEARSSGLHEAIQAVDLLSPRFVHDRWWASEEAKAPVCYTGVEVGNAAQKPEDPTGKNRALESQLRHGLRQLQYALPALVAFRAWRAVLHPPDENFPFFFVPILLTNAELIVSRPDFGMLAVESAETLRDLGSHVPYLVWSADLGPDFYIHCQRQLKDLRALASTENMKAVEERRAAAGIPTWLQPSDVAQQIIFDGSRTEGVAEFTDVVVVHIESLAQVIKTINAAFVRMATSLKDEPLVQW